MMLGAARSLAGKAANPFPYTNLTLSPFARSLDALTTKSWRALNPIALPISNALKCTRNTRVAYGRYEVDFTLNSGHYGSIPP